MVIGETPFGNAFLAGCIAFVLFVLFVAWFQSRGTGPVDTFSDDETMPLDSSGNEGHSAHGCSQKPEFDIIELYDDVVRDASHLEDPFTAATTSPLFTRTAKIRIRSSGEIKLIRLSEEELRES